MTGGSPVQTLTEQLLHSRLAERPFTSGQLQHEIAGSPQQRHGLVNRALKAGELLKIRRGLYLLGDRYRNRTQHPFALAQALAPGSYISLESALAHHGWIPEAVRTIASVVPGRKSWQLDHPLVGRFSFHPLAIQRGYFLELVERQAVNSQVILVARPVRALLDLVCLRKEEWQTMAWLTEALRIEPAHLQTIRSSDLIILKNVYQQQRVHDFIHSLAGELRA